MPTAPWPLEVVEAVEMVNMARGPEADVEVAVTVPARRLPMVEVDIVALMANRLVEVAEVEVDRLKVCPPVQVLMFPRLRDATTAPVVALMPLANVEVPVPPTFTMPLVWMLPSVVVAMPTPNPPVR